MYNAGFGDCFLITIPAPDRPRKILIDCGKHTLCAAGPKLDRVVQQVLLDIAEGGAHRIDVLVVSHRHQDHVKGFSIQPEIWDKVEVGEVWMPWTESPDDPAARAICDRQSKRATKAHASLALTPNNEYLLGYAGNNLTNAVAMKLLHEGFQGNPKRKFLPEEGQKQFTTSVLPGVQIYTLGPSRDPAVLAEMDPPELESFFTALETDQTAPANRPSVFSARWELDRANYKARMGDFLDEVFPQSSETHLAKVMDEPALELTARIEGAVNATSLVLLFHIGNAWLLFPGDAQWGSWNAILQDSAAMALLENLTFYKVGHHGSHNATPVSFANRFLTNRVRTMLPYGKVAKWPDIPRTKLLECLKNQGVSFARSDEPAGAGQPFATTQEDGEVLYIDTMLPV